jgi:hypothetical protein
VNVRIFAQNRSLRGLREDLHTSLTARICNLPAVGLSALNDGFVRYQVEWLIVLNRSGEVHNMKKSKKKFIGMTFLALALAAISAFVLMGRHSVSAATASSASTTAQGGTMPPVFIFALTTDNTLYVLPPNSITPTYLSLGRVVGIGGNDLIGIDFRPADKKLYALSDAGRLYTINFNVAPPTATLVSTLSPRFPSGFQSLMDFNPVVDAIRLIGGDTLNYAVVKNASNILATTAVQTSLTYAVGDVNAGKTPKVIGGAYNNNVAGATTTIFYAMDHDLDTLVTIADKTATGSSNTGGGRLQTIGRLVDSAGNQITVNALADIDIVTLNGVNFLVGASRDITFQISLNQINPNLPLGTTQNVVVQGFGFPTNPASRSSFIDIAASTLQ